MSTEYMPTPVATSTNRYDTDSMNTAINIRDNRQQAHLGRVWVLRHQLPAQLHGLLVLLQGEQAHGGGEETLLHGDSGLPNTHTHTMQQQQQQDNKLLLDLLVITCLKRRHAASCRTTLQLCYML
jgi:hypothetical protein